MSIIRNQPESLDSSSISFIFFPLLPTELRIQIWRYYPSPRIFEIRGLEEYECGCICRLSTEDLPATFAVNQESRSKFQKLYVRWESKDLWKLDVKTSRKKNRYIYFNSHLDTFMLPQDAADWWLLSKLCLKFHVKHLAIHQDDAWLLLRNDYEFYELWSVLDSLTILEEIDSWNDFSTGSVLFVNLADEVGLFDLWVYVCPSWCPRFYQWSCDRAVIEGQEPLDYDGWVGSSNPKINDIPRFLRWDMIRLRNELNGQVPGPGAKILIMAAYVTRIGNCFCLPSDTESDQEGQWTRILRQR